MSKPGQNLWSTEDTETARRLLAQGAGPEEFIRVLNRTLRAARSRINYLDNPTVRDRTRDRVRRQRGQDTVQHDNGSSRHPERPRSIPDSVIADAMRRNLAARSITAFVFGDPPPGYSALDKRNAEVSA